MRPTPKNPPNLPLPYTAPTVKHHFLTQPSQNLNIRLIFEYSLHKQTQKPYTKRGILTKLRYLWNYSDISYEH